MQYFGKLVQDEETDDMSSDEIKERRIMTLLLKVKNGTPPQRKMALRQLSEKSRMFGAGNNNNNNKFSPGPFFYK